MGFIKAFSFKPIMHFDLSLPGYSSLAPSSHPFPARPFLCPHSLSSTLNHIYKAHGRKCHVCPSESAHLSSDDHLQKHPLLQMTFFVAECHIFFICSFVLDSRLVLLVSYYKEYYSKHGFTGVTVVC